MVDPHAITPPATDDSQEMRDNPTGTKGHYSGQEYDSHARKNPPQVAVGAGEGGVARHPIDATHAPGEAIPEEAGRRAHVDQRTGEVHGSGMGAGGGSEGENYDND
ncbi:hypothetical protein [Sphingomonas abaci]|uniref:Uncharacterized protein n=1 Tax=Sphingomonas abaci TaxID=237611 RepID=A0A7W7EY58_9SPHN|nr:hypothetical protein [Sphingomonas abaci]MBB4618393.1 hypothetical protein [Sphingomonas abaci]